MKILITGGCGFLGSNIAERFIRKGKDEIFILDNLFRKGSEKNLEWLQGMGPLSFYKIDIQDKDKVDECIRSIHPDVIYHLAGQVAMTTSIENPRLDFEVNALGSLNVLESIRRHAPSCIVVYSSTNKVYGDLEQYTYEESETRYFIRDKEQGFNETEQLNFHSPYGCSKGTADQYMLDYHRLFGVRSVVFRHSSMFGGRQFATYDQGWVGWFCQKALEIKDNRLAAPFTISGSGKQVRDVLHAQDAIDLYASTIEHIDKINGQAFNIGGGFSNSLSLLELFEILEEELGIKMIYEKIKVRQSDQKIFIADFSKYAGLTGWTPRIDKREGVKMTLNWLNG